MVDVSGVIGVASPFSREKGDVVAYIISGLGGKLLHFFSLI